EQLGQLGQALVEIAAQGREHEHLAGARQGRERRDKTRAAVGRRRRGEELLELVDQENEARARRTKGVEAGLLRLRVCGASLGRERLDPLAESVLLAELVLGGCLTQTTADHLDHSSGAARESSGEVLG